MSSYVALHNQSYYSILESACRIDELVAAAVRRRMPALALTDKHSISGSVEFVKACAGAGLKPIIGSELTLEGGAPLVVLCRSDAGYANLSRLLTRSTQEYHPITWRRLMRHREGLIALSGGRRSEIAGLIAAGNAEAAARRARFYEEMFPGNFYIELFHHEPGDMITTKRLWNLAQRLQLPVAAAPNTHYVKEEDRGLYEVLASIGTLTLLREEHPQKKLTGDYRFRTGREMEQLFGHLAGALENTVKIAKACEVDVFQEVMD